MDWASAAIGLGGIVVAAMGLLFTYRTCLSPYQQTLYERQLDAASSVLSSLGRYHEKVRRFLLDPHAAGATWADLDRYTADVSAEFFGAFRQSSIILPASVTESINACLEVLRGLGEHSEARIRDASRGNDDPGTRLAAAYSVVVSAARQGLRTKALSDRALGSLGSQNLTPETGPAIDPLLVKVRAESPVFEDFVDESRQKSPASASGSATSLRTQRDRIYVSNRNLFLIHTWRPSVAKGQVADISIRPASVPRLHRLPIGHPRRWPLGLLIKRGRRSYEDSVWFLAGVRSPVADGAVDPGGTAGRPRRRGLFRRRHVGPGRPARRQRPPFGRHAGRVV